MANGMEDLREKNKDRKPVDTNKYRAWATFQGREDAEMLEEKSAGWSAQKSARDAYDNYDRDDW